MLPAKVWQELCDNGGQFKQKVSFDFISWDCSLPLGTKCSFYIRDVICAMPLTVVKACSAAPPAAVHNLLLSTILCIYNTSSLRSWFFPRWLYFPQKITFFESWYHVVMHASQIGLFSFHLVPHTLKTDPPLAELRRTSVSQVYHNFFYTLWGNSALKHSKAF
jgi:hypothetical protein